MRPLPDGGDADRYPHEGTTIETAGGPPQVAHAAVIMLHGRGSTAQSILRLIDEFYAHGVMYLAPQATRNRWYPRSGFAPLPANESWLSSALKKVTDVVDTAVDVGISRNRILLFGFSQGGCLASEFVARNPRQYGGLITLSGSLLGPEPTVDEDGDLEQTLVFFGWEKPIPPSKHGGFVLRRNCFGISEQIPHSDYRRTLRTKSMTMNFE